MAFVTVFPRGKNSFCLRVRYKADDGSTQEHTHTVRGTRDYADMLKALERGLDALKVASEQLTPKHSGLLLGDEKWAQDVIEQMEAAIAMTHTRAIEILEKYAPAIIVNDFEKYGN